MSEKWEVLLPCVCTLILQTKHLNQQHLAKWHLLLALLHKQEEDRCMREEMWPGC